MAHFFQAVVFLLKVKIFQSLTFFEGDLYLTQRDLFVYVGGGRGTTKKAVAITLSNETRERWAWEQFP